MRVQNPSIVSGGSGSSNGTDITQSSTRPAFKQDTDAAPNTIILTTGVPILVNVSTEAPTAKNRQFSRPRDNTYRFTGDTPVWMDVNTTLNGSLASGLDNMELSYYRNGAQVYFSTPVYNSTFGTHAILDKVSFIKGDELTIYMENEDTSANFDLRHLACMGSFDGWTTEDSLLGSELYANPNFTDNTTGLTASNCTLSVSGGELTATATAATAYVDLDVTGLTASDRIRVAITARRGSQGTTQRFDSSDFFTSTAFTRNISTTSDEIGVFEGTNSATSGYVRVYVADSGAIGDEVILSSPSFKEFL